MYEANAGLGWRDVQDILASSAVTVGSAGGARAGNELYQWTANGAERWNGGGMHFSNDYGFGLVDATAAVRLAETWFIGGQTARTSANQGQVTSDMLNGSLAIPDNTAAGVTVNGVFAGGSNFQIEYTTITVTMSPNHSFMGDLEITVTSASGSQSVIHDNTGGETDFPGTWTFMTRAFRGEYAAGTWSVNVADLAGADTGTLTNVVVEHHGSSNINNVHIFTNQYSDFGGAAGRNSVGDSNGGIDTINAAAVTTASRIILGGASSLIDGRTLNISVNFDNAIGGDGNDSLTGNTRGNVLHGGRGNDLLNGGGAGGRDTMTGGIGNDTYSVYNATDIINEGSGQGTDRVAAAVSFALASNDFIEVMTTTSSGGTGAINLTGNAFVQAITGNAGVNVLSDGGGAGADTLTGLAGNDTYIVRNAGTRINESAGQGTADRVAAGVSFTLAADDHVEIMNTTSSGGTTAINLTGNALAQSIAGNAGANVLNGGAGNDTLTGGGGVDSFVFANTLGSGNVDTITDFNVAADTIRLQNAVFTALTITGTLSSAAFLSNTTGAAGDASDRIIYDNDSGNLFYDADGTGAGAGVRFAVLDAGLSLTNADFFVI